MKYEISFSSPTEFEHLLRNNPLAIAFKTEYKPNDELVIREYDKKENRYTGRELTALIESVTIKEINAVGEDQDGNYLVSPKNYYITQLRMNQ